MPDIAPNDTHRIEHGLEKLNDKMDSVHADLTKIMVQNAQHLTRTDTHAKDIDALKLQANKLELTVNSLKTKLAPILVVGTMIVSVVITKISGVVWPQPPPTIQSK